jgi:glycosyltransferase involved in cell wall biosynthesis
MRIMEILSGAGVNGAIVHCKLLTEQLLALGHEVTLVCRPRAWIARQLADSSAEIIESDLHRWPTDELKRIAAIVRERRIDVVHTHMSRANFFGVLLRWAIDVPVVATAHAHNIQPHWMFNDFVIANSEATQRFHRRINFVRRKRIDTIHCFIDTERFGPPQQATRQSVRRELSVAPDAFLGGIIGSVIERKGHLHLVRAMPRILEQTPQFELLIVGGGKRPYREKVEREAQRLGVARHIHWTGSRDDVPRLMQGIDLCVCAALEEPLGLTALEAMAAARPVVATRVGGLNEIVVDGETGLLVPPADPLALAEAIASLANDTALAERLAIGGARRIESHFSPRRQTLRHAELFQQIVELRSCAVAAC